MNTLLIILLIYIFSVFGSWGVLVSPIQFLLRVVMVKYAYEDASRKGELHWNGLSV